jgi:antitoxin component HigA of HigAB toxin-antitoxin module
MIRNDDELEIALGQVTSWIECPPDEGTPEDRRFQELLEAIEDYRPRLQAPAPTPEENAERAQLRREVEAFEKKVEEHRSTVMGDVDATFRPLMGRGH